MSKKQQYKQFLVRDGVFVPTTDIASIAKIEPGVYELSHTMNGELIFLPKKVTFDNYIEMPSMVTARILAEIEEFWSQKVRDKFDKFGLVYKRGVMMYGPPGTGKTTIVSRVISRVTEEGGIALYNGTPREISSALSALRDIQGDCKVVCIFEEFDKYCSSADFLSLLDGELQVNNVLYLATTNFIDNIPDSIKKRPSRFATLVEVGTPDAAARAAYLSSKLKDSYSPEEIEGWVSLTDGCVIDQLKDIIINVECFERPLKSSIKLVKRLGSKSIGIKGKEEDEDKLDFGIKYVLNGK